MTEPPSSSSSPPRVVTRRHNGLQPPWAALQVASWVTLPTLLIQLVVFCSPVLPVAASVPVTLLIYGVAAVSTYYAYLACVVDPMDLHLAKHLMEQQQRQQLRSNAENGNGHGSNNNNNFTTTQEHNTLQPLLPSSCWYKPPRQLLSQEQQQQANDDDDDDESLKYCWVCETSVAEHAMHCKYCNKCISHFDHHCQWLNTCIGEANYAYFYKTLWGLCLFLALHTCVQIGLLVAYHVDDGNTERRAEEWMFNANIPELLVAVWIFFVIFNGIAFGLMVQLLWFHINLRRQDLTTYQFILKDGQRRREAYRLKTERKAERFVAVQEAKERGHYNLAWRLQLGAYGCCDPLPPTTTTSSGGGMNNDENAPVAEEEEEEETGNGILLQENDAPPENGNGGVDKDYYEPSPSNAMTMTSVSESNNVRSIEGVGNNNINAGTAHATAAAATSEEAQRAPISWEKV